MLNIPIFRCADRYGGVIRTSSDRALPYGDFQEFLCRLGRNAGLRQELTPYCFRRGAADILDSMLSRRLEFGSELPLILCDREIHTCGAQPDDGSFSIKHLPVILSDKTPSRYPVRIPPWTCPTWPPSRCRGRDNEPTSTSRTFTWAGSRFRSLVSGHRKHRAESHRRAPYQDQRTRLSDRSL